MIRQILIATAISLIVFVLGCSSILSSIFSSPLVNLAAIDFLTKPVTAKEVVDRVQALLQLSRLKAGSEEEKGPKSRILIVDDNRSIVRLAERTLQKEGYDVITAFDGLDGLRRVKEEKPDLIILDIVMPGLNGFQVLGLVRQHTKTPVIMLTTECYMDSVKSTLALGADDYVVKPFSARDLLARVREKIGRTGVGVPLLERDWT